jgi:hypothetical protein
MNCLIIGTGYMAFEYIKSILKLDISCTIIGNTKNTCDKLKQKIKDELNKEINIIKGGIENIVIINEYTHAIIATPIELLEEHLLILLKYGIKNILIEKPGGLDFKNLNNICNDYSNRNIFVAYNRRFYKTIQKALEIINQDDGVLSFTINITELIHLIDESKYNKKVLDKWVYSMTSHILDLAFYLGGIPNDITCHSNNKLKWHDSSAVFSGCGKTINNALFSYHGNWMSAGRWKIELYTKNHLILLCPLEELHIQKKGELHFNKIDCTNNEISNNIKEGVFEMVNEFMYIKNNINNKLITLKKHCYNTLHFYKKIANY